MEITKTDIRKLIDVEKADSFFNHLVAVVTRDYRAKGEIKPSEIVVWSQSFWTGVTYPVFTFKLDSKNNLIDITDRLNPVGLVFYFGFISFLIFLFTPQDITNIAWENFWPLALTVVLFLAIFVLITTRIYRFEKQEQLNEIFELLDIEVDSEKSEQEWSLKNIMIRLFTYPFCAFLIWLNVFIAIPTGNYGLAMGTAIFVIPYLYFDITLIMRKKTTGNKEN
ncbi:hypothetical protein RM553_17540 [Zunongwangia sp. F363]|uniref:DUF3278 domain-containing protein n=1 Tax=Autumnicola tepida TaxID=3075595 RepID=A0ABU3CE71_9FLAO|nr:hypothetical protein [Zunongwangia sp. F363]MDT0644647.1 hypothetical protein [Zunongwangia sp. F363]